MSAEERSFRFSIIVPTRNRPEQVKECVRSLVELDYPREQYEVIVVDDGGDHALEESLEALHERLNVTLIRQRQGGPASARNTGAARARGKWLAFTDDDCRPASDWLTRLEVAFHEVPDRMLGGKTLNALTHNLCAVTSQLILDIVYQFYNPDPGNARFFASNNMAVPAKLYAQLNGFDTRFPVAGSEDRELCDRWIHAGYQLTYIPQARIHHAHCLTLRGFCRQHFNYGRGAFRYHQLRAERGSGKMRDEMAFHARLPRQLVRPLSRLAFTQGVGVVMLLFLWQWANALGYSYEKWRVR